MLTEKCNEFGDVQRIEDKGNNGLLVVFSSEWEAERAISILIMQIFVLSIVLLQYGRNLKKKIFVQSLLVGFAGRKLGWNLYFKSNSSFFMVDYLLFAIF